jgi:hypothetical protein
MLHTRVECRPVRSLQCERVCACLVMPWRVLLCIAGFTILGGRARRARVLDRIRPGPGPPHTRFAQAPCGTPLASLPCALRILALIRTAGADRRIRPGLPLKVRVVYQLERVSRLPAPARPCASSVSCSGGTTSHDLQHSTRKWLRQLLSRYPTGGAAGLCFPFRSYTGSSSLCSSSPCSTRSRQGQSRPRQRPTVFLVCRWRVLRSNFASRSSSPRPTLSPSCQQQHPTRSAASCEMRALSAPRAACTRHSVPPWQVRNAGFPPLPLQLQRPRPLVEDA